MFFRKMLFISVATIISLPALASVQSVSCTTVGDNSGCDACFYETQNLYTRTASDTTAVRDSAVDLSDIAINTAGSTKVIYHDLATPATYQMWSVNFSRLQTSIDWSKSHTDVDDMFQITSEFLTPASAPGEVGYQNFGTDLNGYLLPVGTSVKWTEMIASAWLRPDIANSGATRSDPAYRVALTPRFYTTPTEYTDHRQCVFYYVAFCGDGTTDSGNGEQCDDGNMTNGDGCDNLCQTEPDPTTPSIEIIKDDADNTDDTQSVVSGGTATFTITVNNDGTESLQNVVVTDAESTSCSRTSAETDSLYAGSTFDPGESFTYTCTKTGVTSSTFLDGDNDISVTGIGVTSSTTVTDEDPTTVTLTTVTNPACTGLSTTPSSVVDGWTVSVSCNGTNASSYRIELRNPSGTLLNTIASASGTFTIPSSPTGAYETACYINGQTSTPAVCTDTVTNLTGNGTSYTPAIVIDKDDADNSDDTQQVISGNTAVFTITVSNVGTDSLVNVAINDAYASECNLTTTQVNGYLNAKYGDSVFEPGETFSYTCSVAGVTSATFPGETNTICTTGTGLVSGGNVSDCDDTRITVPTGGGGGGSGGGTIPQCTGLTQEKDFVEAGGSISFTCNGTQASNYRIDVTGPNGFSRTFDSQTAVLSGVSTTGTYSAQCYVNNSYTSTSCADTFTVFANDAPACLGVESSRGTFGGVPFETTFSCNSSLEDTCMIYLYDDNTGEVINQFNTCEQTVQFTDIGTYRAKCYLDQGGTSDACEMRVSTDAATEVETGMSQIIFMVLLALLVSGATFFVYQRRTA